MSYILDALQRAAAERERGTVPGIGAQSLSATAAPQSGGGGRPWLWAAGGGLVVLLGAVAWRLGTPDARMGPVAASSPAPTVAAPAPVPAPPPVPEAKPAPVVEKPPASVPREVAAEASSGARAAARPLPAPAGAAPAPLPPRAVPSQAQLPPEIQRELPKLVVSGSTWSETPAWRMLILNGQVFHEGDEAAPGVVIERIHPRSAVLTYREHRYTISY